MTNVAAQSSSPCRHAVAAQCCVEGDRRGDGQKNSELADRLKAEVADLKNALPAAEEKRVRSRPSSRTRLSRIPNTPLDDVPVRRGRKRPNVVTRVVGAKPGWNHKPLEHFEIGEALD